MKKYYRVKIKCFGCDKIYVTNKLKNKIPARCKHCHSIKLYVLRTWELG